MEFTPHTDADVAEMLGALGLQRLEDLFEAVPAGVRLQRPLQVPPALSEPELLAHLAGLAAADRAHELVCFAGGGAYDHHVPAAVSALASRAEYAT